MAASRRSPPSAERNEASAAATDNQLLWRIVNASTISGFYLPALPPGFTWRQTAQDGVQFDNFNYNSRAERPVFVAPGNRIDQAHGVGVGLQEFTNFQSIFDRTFKCHTVSPLGRAVSMRLVRRAGACNNS